MDQTRPSSSTDRAGAFTALRRLHDREGIFVLANAWDAGSARLLAAAGFEALGTTSAGFAFFSGLPDDVGMLSRESVLANAAAIAAATPLPVSADLMNGFGETPEACAGAIEAAASIGLAGASIEDSASDPNAPIFAFAHAVERVAAAAEAAARSRVLLTARAENYLHGRDDLDDTTARLQAFARAGADVVYAPGLTDLDEIRLVCSSVAKPVNVLMGFGGATYRVDELRDAGVKRVSVGGAFARAAFGALARAAREVREQGTFGFAADAIPHAELMRAMAPAGVTPKPR